MSEITERLNVAIAGRYLIERELGQGGMATVYLAQDLKHDRKVALKVLRPELAAVLGAERFVQEIKTTAALQHPHILPLYDSGRTGGPADERTDAFLYYVMPYIEGETLRDKLNRETQLGVEEAVRITTEVADALDYAHTQGVIHRDIKPENSDGQGRAMTLERLRASRADRYRVGAPRASDAPHPPLDQERAHRMERAVERVEDQAEDLQRHHPEQGFRIARLPQDDRRVGLPLCQRDVAFGYRSANGGAVRQREVHFTLRDQADGPPHVRREQ